MRKRPLCMLAGGVILGILLAAYVKWYLILAVIILSIGIAASFFKEGKRFYACTRTLLFCIGVWIGANRFLQEEQFSASYESQLQQDMQLEIQGKVVKKEYKSEHFIYTLDNCYLNLKTGMIPCNQILLYLDADPVPIGKIILTTGKVNIFREAFNEGNFDEKSYYRGQKIAFRMTNPVISRVEGKEDAYRESLYLLRQNLQTVYLTVLPQKEAGILSTMILGDKSLLDTEIKELYQKVGISHMLAISGLHVSFIGMTLYRFLRKRRFSFLGAGIISGLAILSFGVMSGMGASTFRAILMFLLSIFAAWAGRSYDSGNALGAAAILLLFENPLLLWYAGFLFSFAAVGGVIGIGTILEKAVLKQNTASRFEKWKTTIRISMAIQLATLPLAAYYYFEVSTYSLVINFMLLPFLGYVLLFGILGGVVGLLLPQVAKWLLFPCRLILGIYEKVSEWMIGLPGANWIVGKPQLWKMVLFYVILIVVIVIIKYRKKRGILVVMLGMLVFLFCGNGRSGFELSMLDVGQGDGIFIRTIDQVVFFIDGGSTDVSSVGTYRILPFLKANGVKKVSYWFVTHMDEDHIAGLKEALEADYTIEHLVLSKWILQDEAYEEVVNLAAEHQTTLIFLDEGDRLCTKTAAVTCLLPTKEMESADRNALSLVLWYEEQGVSALLTGDISSTEEAVMQNAREESAMSGVFANTCEIYKAAHHGSAYSNSQAFLEVLQPQIALVSCGEDNQYGHPGKAAVDNMINAGSEVFYTMNSGQLTITRKDDRIWIEKYRDKLDVCYYPVVE